ncbi:MAG TPA: mandelate racemase/muconate lactonizing enzyme family protein, partial [Chloroflexota bacterium]|nr:mandelate racemase/muconate lactonizing enzyme family protein [Chloroflexota bacterium]
LKELLIGQNPLDHERLWHAMWVPKLIGRRGLTTRAISTIDIALWDLKAKAAGMPLFRLLGGYAERVPTYIAGGYYEEGKGLAELAREMVENVELGARAVKMKVGAVSNAEDASRVRAVREAVGPDVKVMVDANCAYRAYQAIQLAKRIEEYDVFWFEEPVGPDDYEGHARVASQTSIPIATGENEYTRYGFRDLIAHGAAAILNADAQVLGGVTEFMKVAALAQAHDLDIAPHGDQNVHVHLVAAIANGLIVEYYRDSVDPMWRQMYRDTLLLNDDGTLSPPDRPGLGVELNDDALGPWRVE